MKSATHTIRIMRGDKEYTATVTFNMAENIPEANKMLIKQHNGDINLVAKKVLAALNKMLQKPLHEKLKQEILNSIPTK